MSHIKLENLHLGGLKIYRDADDFSFGTDAVLLAWFASEKMADKMCDLCTGNGIIPLLACTRLNKTKIYGVEIDTHRAQLAQQNVLLNGLEDRMEMIEGDLRQIDQLLPSGQFDLVSVNPPYLRMDSGFHPTEIEKGARMELFCTFADVAQAGKYLLKQGGRFCVIHRTERLTDVLCMMRQNLLEPKRIRFIVTREGKTSDLFLCEGKKCAKPGLKMELPVVIYDRQGKYTPLLQQIYGRELCPEQ